MEPELYQSRLLARRVCRQGDGCASDTVALHAAGSCDNHTCGYGAIVCDSAAPYSLARLDAADGHVAWTTPLEIKRVLGAHGGAAVVHLREAIALVSLATGKTTEQPVASGDAVALLADGTVIVQDFLGIVHRYRLGGGDLGSFLVPRNTRLAARADGRFGLLLTMTGVQTIDPLAGALLEVGDEQTAPIRALDASASTVISVGEDGSIVVRRPDGALVKRMHATSRHCLATAASAASREVMCAADIGSVVGLAGREPPTHGRDRPDVHRRGSTINGANSSSHAAPTSSPPLASDQPHDDQQQRRTAERDEDDPAIATQWRSPSGGAKHDAADERADDTDDNVGDRPRATPSNHL